MSVLLQSPTTVMWCFSLRPDSGSNRKAVVPVPSFLRWLRYFESGSANPESSFFLQKWSQLPLRPVRIRSAPQEAPAFSTPPVPACLFYPDSYSDAAQQNPYPFLRRRALLPAAGGMPCEPYENSFRAVYPAAL